MSNNDRFKQDLWNLMDLGWHLFPISPNSKLPIRGYNWTQLSSNDDDQIEKIKNIELFNFAVHCGPSGLLIIDIDGKIGEEALSSLERRLGPLPSTITARTPSGGMHLYYKAIDGASVSVSRLGPQIDIRADNGYALIPPSSIDGKPYRWELSPIEENVQVLPIEWQREILEMKHNKPGEQTGRVNPDSSLYQIVGKGARNNTLYAYACSVIARGLGKYLSQLVRWYNLKYLEPPLDERELSMVINSSKKYIDKTKMIPEWYMRRMKNEQK